jgi:dihydropteroate synthase
MIHELKQINVDPDAFELFVHKISQKVIKLEALSCAQANVLKQIALVCGADCAIPRTVYHGTRRKKVPVMLIANQRELEKITGRLKEQPWMLSIAKALDEYAADTRPVVLKLKDQSIEFTRTFVMGVINITPDSFYGGSRFTAKDTVMHVAEEMEKEGADFLDVGAESSRPYAKPLSAKKEIERLRQILPYLADSVNIPISIDTYKADVASFAIDNGATIVNDISGLRLDKKLASIVARQRVGLIIMHMKGVPRNMQVKPHYDDLMGELHSFFHQRIHYVLDKGIDLDHIIVDPGLGFGKRLEDNYEIINRLSELACFRRPVLVGHSRKSFIGKPFDIAPEGRLEGTLGVESLLIQNGAHILRVHDVYEAKKVAQLVDRILA